MNKIRPATIPSRQSAAVAAAVTPNPAASSLNWPMSYPGEAPLSSERGSFGQTETLARKAATTTKSTPGAMYDPVRQNDPGGVPFPVSQQQQGEQQRLPSHHDSVAISTSTQQEPEPYTPSFSLESSKRKREADDHPSSPTDSHHLNGTPTFTPIGGNGTSHSDTSLSGKKHSCPHCNATFTRQHNLKSHLLTHTSSRKEYNCRECGNEFRRLHDLKRHSKLHTGEKPFMCEICGRKYD